MKRQTTPGGRAPFADSLWGRRLTKGRPRNHLRLEVLEHRRLLASVAGRFIFYNDSFFDGDDSAINAADDAAIDTSKTAYRPVPEITVTRLTNNTAIDSSPDVFGSTVVWHMHDGNDNEIMFYDGGTPIQLTNNTEHDRFPKVSSSGIIWDRGVTSDTNTGHIIFYDGMERVLGDNSKNAGNAVISGDRVSWESGIANDIEIMSWDVVPFPTVDPDNISNTTGRADRYPDAAGDQVVWLSNSASGGVPFEVMLFDGTTTETIGHSILSIADPDVDGSLVAWEGFKGTATNDREIFKYDGTTALQLTDNAFPDWDPQVSDGKIVWWGGTFNNFHVYMWDGSAIKQLSSGIRNRYPRIDGDNVVWYGYDGHDEEILLWNGKQVIQLTDNDYDDTEPRISGNHIVWQANTPDGLEIFEAAIGTNALPAVAANITGYSKGINGIMVDLLGAGNHTSISANDFVFVTGNNNSPSSWSTAPAPSAVSVRTGAGTSDPDRVEITWADGAISKEWLGVKVLANSNTGLPADDYFFFGNAVGDGGVGNTATTAPVNSTDELGARNNPHNFLNPALVDDQFDYNKDHSVNATDQLISRNNGTNFLTQLVKIDIGDATLFTAGGGSVEPSTAAAGDAGISSALAAMAVTLDPKNSNLRASEIAYPARGTTVAANSFRQLLERDRTDAADEMITAAELDDELLDVLANPLASWRILSR